MRSWNCCCRSLAAAAAAAVAVACGDATDPDAPAAIRFELAPQSVRQGDVAVFSAEALNKAGAALAGTVVAWSVSPGAGGRITAEGRFVGYDPGTVWVVAAAGTARDSLEVVIAPRNGASGVFSVVGRGTITARWTSDLWVAGTAAYTGTWGNRGIGQPRVGDRLYVWDVLDPAQPTLVDSVVVDAGTVNDVKIRAPGGDLAVITHEDSQDGLNGITLLDLTIPLAPAKITRFTQSLERGVHNAWIEGDFVYLAVDGASSSAGLRIVDISTPASPTIAASFYGGTSFVHDVYVRDGLAFVSHWDAGLVILDVGNGVAGGSPAAPIEVGRVVTDAGRTHNAWYWPAGRYVFVGEENFGRPGVMHVVDVRDLSAPVEVATFAVPGTAPHNFWMDEARGILYLAWYGNGIRAVDATGELLGQLERQGREIAGQRYAGQGNCPDLTGAATCTWAPQLHGGVLYLSDMNTGLWVLRPEF